MESNQTVSGEQMAAAVPPDASYSTQQAQERVVPLSALEAERAKRQQMEEDYKMMRDNLMLMQAQRQPAAPVTKDDFQGLEDSDVMTVGEFKKHTSRLANQFQMTLEELRISQRNPDYQEVVRKYLPEVIKTNPGLRDSLEKSQDYELAYYLAKNSDSYRNDHQRAQKNEEAERIMRNTQQAGSLSSMGSSSPVFQSKRYKDMSDEEFRELTARNLGY